MAPSTTSSSLIPVDPTASFTALDLFTTNSNIISRSSSSSSSDNSTINSRYQLPIMSAASTLATIDDHNPKVPPTLTPGRVTPEVLLRWERACKEYFRVKSIPEKKKVESILSRLQDVRTADWAEANEAVLKELSFSNFMEKLRAETLEKGWDRKIKLSILASKQGERPFYEWAYEIQTRNTLLRGRPGHFDGDALRETLEINMDPGLELRMRRMTIEDVSLRDWIEAVKVEDEFMSREKEMAKEAAKEIYRAERAKAKDAGIGRPPGFKNAAHPTPTTSSTVLRPMTNTPALPKLTPAERTIIFDHQGCFKCRQLYVDHKGANCPNGFPAPSTYKTLTVEQAEAVRDSKNKSRSRGLGSVALKTKILSGGLNPEAEE